MENRIYDPTYAIDEIRERPEWELAWTLSEIMNDNSPIGWSQYIWIAELLLRKYTIKIKAN